MYCFSNLNLFPGWVGGGWFDLNEKNTPLQASKKMIERFEYSKWRGRGLSVLILESLIVMKSIYPFPLSKNLIRWGEGVCPFLFSPEIYE
jgi:hypothetical protein